jgi:hypothetical protein
LEQLNVNFVDRPGAEHPVPPLRSAHIQSVLDAAGSMEHLVKFKLLGLESTNDLASLQRCASLRGLFLRWYGLDRMSDGQSAVLRRMTQLEQLGFGSMDPEIETDAWVQLLSTPPYLPLQSVAESDEPVLLSAELTALLPRLPSLTALSVFVEGHPSRFTGVAHLPNLRSLELRVGDVPDPVDGMVQLARTIRACHGLQKLALSMHDDIEDNGGFVLSSPLLASCLAGLPTLHTLLLQDVRLSSLAFLSSPPLQRSLTSFTLVAPVPRMLPEELVHVCGLKALQELTLQRVFAEPILKHMERQLCLPSKKLPALVRSNIADAFLAVTRRDRAEFGMPLLSEAEYEEEDT